MRPTWRILLVSANIVLALLVFQNGFLLKRQEITAKSSCAEAHPLPGQACWMEQQYKRIILILVDALRYDFLRPISSTKITKKMTHYRGHMTNVAELVKSGNATIGTLLADPPTTTLQRLKALTTGTLPTFIDAGDNFSPDAAVNEDSFVYQAAALGKNVTILGDDTWLSLYPKSFAKSQAYDSFDINDLNSVDDKIAPTLEQEIASKNSSSIIIAHFLGVDHCGHKFGPSHPVMGDTLRKMDKIIGKTVDAMRADDLLIVLGDHGMTATGDHGGESELEVRAGVLVHSKKQQILLPRRAIHQIDVVPTISLLMGLPIPFSNLGSVIVELFPRDLWETAVALNYEQIKRFAETYATQKNFGELHTHTSRDANTMDEQTDVMSRIQTTLRVAWTQFDDAYINAGIFSLFEAITFLMTNEHFSNEWIVIRTGCAFLQAALLSDKTDSDGTAHTLLMMAIGVSCVSSMLGFAQKALQMSVSSFLSSRTIGCLFVLLHSISLFSNSFVVYEAQVIRYLLQSLIFVIYLGKLRDAPKQRKPYKLWKFLNRQNSLVYCLGFIAALRLEPYFHKCREEEVGCVLYYAVRQAASLTLDAQVLRILGAIVLICIVNYVVHNYMIQRRTSSEQAMVLSGLSWALMMLIAIHHFLLLVNNLESAGGHANALLLFSVPFTISCWYEQNYILAAHFALLPIYLLFGDGLVPAVIVFAVVSKSLSPFVPSPALPSTISLLVPFGFYFLGHSPVISSIPWRAAFVGIPPGSTLRIVPALMVLLHLNFSAIPPLVATSGQSRESLKEALILMTLRATFSCLAASTHRRHLMVWKIFAPKFIFECILCIAFIIVLNLVCLLRGFMSRKIYHEPRTDKNQ